GGYVISEYPGAFDGPGVQSQAKVLVPGRYADASLAVDVALVDPADDQYVDLACRSQGEHSEYLLAVYPTRGQFRLTRWIEGAVTAILPVRDASLIQRGSTTNRLELRC